MKKQKEILSKSRNYVSFKLFIVFLLLVFFLIPLSAKTTSRTIKVGWQIVNGFQDLDESGNPTGYNFEYLSKISQYTGWKYEYVSGTMAELVNKIETGEIDLLGGVAFSEERTKIMNYCSYPTISSFLSLLVKSDNQEISYGEYSSLDNKKIGVLDTGVRDEAFYSFAKNNGFSSTLVPCASDKEAVDKVISGEIYGALVDATTPSSGCKIIAFFDPKDFYFVVPKGEEDFALQLDQVVSSIKILETDFENNLFSKYFPINNGRDFLYLNNEEKQFVAENPILKVYCIEDLPPLFYKDEKNGTNKGFLYDYSKLTIEKTGFNLDYYSEKDLSSIIEKYDSDPNGIFIYAPLDYSWAEEHNSFITQKFFSLPSLLLVTRKHSGSVKKVGVIVNNLLTVLKNSTTNYDYRKFDSIKKGLKALRKGEIDALQMDAYSAESLLRSFVNKDLKFIILNEVQEIAIAVHKDAPFELYSILSKALSSVSQNEKDFLLIENTANVSPSSWREFFYVNSTLTLILMIVFSFFIFFILLLFSNNLTTKRSNKKIKQINEELNQEKLKAEKASYEAYRANQAKSNFLSRMSHEIRTPLNAIVGFHELMRENLDDNKLIIKYLKQADQSSLILLDTINDILDVSAIESNKMKLANLDFDLKDLINEITVMYHELCKQKGITFYARGYNIFQEYLVGDSFRLRQILINLLSNSLKFTEKGGLIEFNVLQTAHKADSVHLRFIIKDNGCGMGPDIQNRLFKEFEQEDSTIVRTHGGSGLGLSIVKSLVEMFEGSIEVESEKGKGSQFSIDMKLLISKEKRPGFRKLSEFKALIVDDDIETCKYVSILCKSLCIENEYTDLPLNGLKLAQRAKDEGNPFNLYIIDEEMPGMNGIELGQKLRIEMGEKAIVMILTGYDINIIRRKCKLLDVNYVLAKPIFKSQLYSLLTIPNKGQMAIDEDSKEYDFTGHKILLAEDNELNIIVATKLLEKVGLKVVTTRNGKQAYEEFLAFRDDEFDLILMDVQMPVMDGYQATYYIRNSGVPCAKTIPIYAMTANAFSEDVKKSLDSGMNGHLAKPINIEILYKVIKECCGEK